MTKISQPTQPSEASPTHDRRTSAIATVKDVARLAGVSTATVSRVLSASKNVSENKRKKVDAAVALFGYVPNEHAASLARMTSRK